MEAKLVENAEKCQNPQSWHILNVPKRYSELFGMVKRHFSVLCACLPAIPDTLWTLAAHFWCLLDVC